MGETCQSRKKAEISFFFAFSSLLPYIAQYEFYFPKSAGHVVLTRRLGQRQVRYSSWLIRDNAQRGLLKSFLGCSGVAKCT